MSQRRSRDESHLADAGSQHVQRRPASIGELADRAIKFAWDPSRDLKHCLRVAERSRNQARTYHDEGDLENAFIYLARAATMVLEKMPTHPAYKTALTELQRENLTLNGQEILDKMSRIKPTLVDRFNTWRSQHPNEPLLPLFDDSDHPIGYTAQDLDRELKEEVAAWKKQHEEWNKTTEETPVRRQSSRNRPLPQPQAALDRRKEDTINSARQAAAPSAYKLPATDYSFSQPPAHGSQNTIVVMPSTADPAAAEAQQRRREREEKRRVEQEGIARRQREADAEARQIRQTIAVNNSLPRGPHGSTLSAHSSASSVTTNGSSPMFPHTQASSLATTPASSFYQVPAPPQTSMPPPPMNPPPLASASAVTMTVQAPSPLTTPARAHPQGPSHMPSATVDQQPYPANEPPEASYLFPGSSPVDLHRTPTRATVRGKAPDFMSTTSPPPQDARSLFPTLMSPHQQRQGYWPSYDSVPMAMDRMTLNDTTNTPTYGKVNIYASTPQNTEWAFGPQESGRSAAAAAAAQVAQQFMDGGGKPRKSKYSNPAPPPPGENSSNRIPYIPMPPPPAGAIAAGGRVHHSQSSRSLSQSDSRALMRTRSQHNHHPGSSLKERKLKTVILPRETLPRFLAIAKVNTSMNRETCGLLLGRERCPDEESPPSYPHYSSRGEGDGKKGKTEYVVTTLLIPKQRGTSDMCSMEGEEQVLSFTEERSLITLGWIHTHPSQSCFMSSVDLHTHSGFQQMLPESVAVVCAPKSNPNFGIFRLTDPPGLQAILNCKENEAFHPHPDLPIYTDADKGHVQMRDAPLEIIDLR